MLARLAVGSYAFSPLILLLVVARAAGQEAPAPPGRNEPLLRLEAGGPTSYVAAMAFSPDGKTLYAAGFDKVVRAWGLNPKTGQFELDQRRHFRVPINPGMDGAINALAVSSDGAWLAVGGLGAMRGTAGFGEAGELVPASALSLQQRLDRGVVYVYSTRGQDVKRLFGHTRPIVALTFAPARAGKPAILVSAAEDNVDSDPGKKSGDVRVWNVDEEKQLGALTTLPQRSDRLRAAPGLAAFHTGDGPNQVRVAVAWGDTHTNAMGDPRGYLRIWDVDRPQNKVTQLEDGYQNTTLVPMPGSAGVLSGSFAGKQGRLKTWSVAAASPQLQDQADLPAPQDSYYFPDALALCSARKSATNYAAVVVRHLDAKGKDIDHRLHLIELRLGRSDKPVRRLALGLESPPVLAATPGGDYLAIAAKADHSIQVYAIGDLLDTEKADDNIRCQTLQSAGISMRHVSFAMPKLKAGKSLGLALGQIEHAGGEGWREGDLIFDFEKRRLTDQVDDWTRVAPQAGQWQVRKSGNAPLELQVLQNNREVSRIRTAADRSQHTWALLPPSASGGPLQTPLLAVASYVTSTGSPRLELYNARTGAHLRLYVGHSAPITSLAFSPDGRLLASAANDQTVCVWSLTDLDEIIDLHGGLPGVELIRKDNDIVIVQVDGDSPAKGRLTKGNVILGHVAGKDALKPLESPRDLQEIFWMARPSTAVTLRVRVGAQTKDVSITAAQGVDVRTPLFTLFVAADKREWVGWNAVGPFDASGPAAEKQVGWHFNTGNAAEPTKFALMNQYHDRFFKKNLLKHLVDEGSLAKALEKQKEASGPRPPAKIQNPLGAATAVNGDFLIRERRVEFAIHDFTPTAQDVVQWQLNDQEPQVLDAPVGNLWSAALPDIPAQGRRDRVRVKVQLAENGKPPTTYTRDWMVRYQPSAPRLTFQPRGARPEVENDAQHDTAASAEYDFRAKLETPDDGPKCKVSFWLNDEKIPTEQMFNRSEQAQEISKRFALREGSNLIKVIAQNDPALAGFEEDERHTLTVRVFHKAAAPVIVVKRIEPIDDEEGTVKNETAQQAIVEAPRVRMVGTIAANAAIASASWQRNESIPAKLSDFKADQKNIAFVQEVELQPGPQTIRIVAKTATSPEGVETVALLYRPQLPALKVKSPDAVLRATGDNSQAEFSVEAALLPPRVPSKTEHPLEAHIVHNGKTSAAIPIPSTAEALPKQKVVLTPGLNQIKVLLNHRATWKGSPASAEFSIQYVFPPRITALRHRLVGTTPFVDLSADVRSRSRPLDGSVMVTVNGRVRQFASAQFKKANGAGADWVLEVKDVPLILDPQAVEGGKGVHTNEIKLQCSNGEAQSDVSEPITVVYKEAPPPPPRIELVSPRSADANLPEPEVTLTFRVHSAKPLKRVVVSREHKTLFQPTELVATAPGTYEFTTPKLPLEWDSNILKIEAVNDGGPQVAFLTLGVAAQPVELVLETLRPDDRPNAPAIKWQDLPDGTRRFLAVPKGRVLVEGKVRWGGQKDDLFKGSHDVRIYVNGFQQLPAKLAPPAPAKPRERTFKSWIVLNLPDNVIEASLPSLPPDERSRKKCEAACQKPSRGQDLHIVLVAPEAQAQKSKELREHMLRALRAEPLEGNLYKTPMSFDVVHFHERRQQSTPDISSILVNVRGILARRAAAGSPNDLVMVYSFAPESGAQPAGKKSTFSLDLNQLENNHFAHFTGAQVLFFDVRSGAGEPAALERELRLALFRYVQPKGGDKSLLLEALEADMPRANYLNELPPFLNERLPAGSLRTNYPQGLNTQLNAGSAGRAN